MNARLVVCAAVAIVATSTSGAQQTALPPVRQLGPVVATARDSFGGVLFLQQLSDGGVLLTDNMQHRVVLLDATLQHSANVIDTSGAAKRRWVGGQGIEGPYRQRADTMLFTDIGADVLMQVDPGGAIGRVFAAPITGLAGYGPMGDGLGGLIYHGQELDVSIGDSLLMAAGHGVPDSLVLRRANMLTHRVDTLAYLRSTRFTGKTLTTSCGTRYYKPMLNPLETWDGWTVLTDGTLAVVRARDLHIDWIAPDGASSSSPKLPYEWHRLSDSAKTALTDSLRRVVGQRLEGVAAKQTDPCAKALTTSRQPEYPANEDLPDYPPPFPRFNGVLSDADNDVWIQMKAGVYLVVNRKGEAIDQVQIPGGTTIVGFGPGVVYLAGRTGNTVQLVRARIR